MMDALKELQDWKTSKFGPWKAKLDKQIAAQKEQQAKMREHAHEVQGIVAMLADGRTKQAVMAWNALGLAPRLRDVRVSPDGETLTLVGMDGVPQVVRLDELIAELGVVLGASQQGA